MDPRITRFRIKVEDSLLQDLRKRLLYCKFPPKQIANNEWKAGTELEYLKDLMRHWSEEYDWPKQQDMLNKFPQFKVTINGLSIHFIHIRSSQPNAIPLLLLHGYSLFSFMTSFLLSGGQLLYLNFTS